MGLRTRTREVHGGLLRQKQFIQGSIADPAIDIQAARMMTIHCAEKMENGADTRTEISAVKVFADMVAKAMEPYGYEELGLIVPHQVNQRIIEAAADRLNLPSELFFTNIAQYGNTSAASVPLALHEAQTAGRLVEGKIICLVAFGAGMCWGHILIRW